MTRSAIGKLMKSAQTTTVLVVQISVPAINYLDICRFFEPESMQTTNGCDSCNLYYYKEDPND